MKLICCSVVVLVVVVVVVVVAMVVTDKLVLKVGIGLEILKLVLFVVLVFELLGTGSAIGDFARPKYEMTRTNAEITLKILTTK
jgi:hypothetical protein